MLSIITIWIELYKAIKNNKKLIKEDKQFDKIIIELKDKYKEVTLN